MAAAALEVVRTPPSSVLEEAREREHRPPALPSGKIVELCGGPMVARTSAAVALCVDVQSRGDPVAWVMVRSGHEAGVFPPDLAAAGLDLDALLVVFAPDGERGEKVSGPKAAEILLRTGGFGAVVLDLSGASPKRQGHGVDAWMGRLLGLAREHDAHLCVLTSEGAQAPSLGPLVAVRVEMKRRRLTEGRYRVEACVLKDKTGQMQSGERIHLAPVGAR